MTLISNKKAHFNYDIQEKMTAGLELLGAEVKALRQSHGSLEGSYVIIRGGEAFLINAYIPPYQPSNIVLNYDERRPRKLLLNKKEIKKLETIEAKNGLSIIPLAVFPAGKKIKIDIAIAKGKKKFDKRETLKKRDAERETRRDIKKSR
jgi:SsrA-binding protein